MKGVILGLAPRGTVIDLTHEIPAGDIRGGAFALAASCRFFPKGTVHVAVVDPGVGSARKAIAVQTAHYFFVGPDNGVLSWALAEERIRAIRSLENEAYFLQPVSRTFHGRDIFAPVAAHLSRGVPIQKLGPRLKGYTRLPWPEPETHRAGDSGRGGLSRPFRQCHHQPGCRCVGTLGKAGSRFFWAGNVCVPWNPSTRPCHGRAVAVLGSSGFLEIAVNAGSAATAQVEIGEVRWCSLRSRSRRRNKGQRFKRT